MAGQFSRGFNPNETDKTSISDSSTGIRRGSASEQGEQMINAMEYDARQRKESGKKPDNERVREIMRHLSLMQDTSKYNSELNKEAKKRRDNYQAWYQQRAENPVEPYNEPQPQLSQTDNITQEPGNPERPRRQRANNPAQLLPKKPTAMDKAGIPDAEQKVFNKFKAAAKRYHAARKSAAYNVLIENGEITHEELEIIKNVRKRFSK